jgi:hypothetical protein
VNDEMLDDLRRWQKEVDALPPSPWCIPMGSASSLPLFGIPVVY